MPPIVPKKFDPKLNWFPEARFGMFIHFGLYSLLERGEWVQYHDEIPREEYVKLTRRFTIKNFDAEEWVDLAAAAGARYIALTTKHHDGFCLFDSKLTDFNIMNTPFGRDLTGELIAACHKKNMRIVLYHSQPDWHHPNHVHRPGAFKDWQPARSPGDEDEPDWEKYLAYLEGQVEELCTNYGRIDGIWWDGSHRRESDWRGRRLYNLIKKHQPAAVVNDRAGYGDFFTPERNIPELPEGYCCECCQAIHTTNWGYSKHPIFFSTGELVGSISKTSGMGGNFLLNVGPKPDGSIRPGEALRMREIGAWLNTNGRAIYKTEGCRLETSDDNIKATRRGNTVYLHLLEWPRKNYLLIPGVREVPKSVKLLGTQEKILAKPAREGMEYGVYSDRHGDPDEKNPRWEGLELSDLPATAPSPLVNVIALEFAAAPKLLLKKRKVFRAPTLPLAAKGKTILGILTGKQGGYGRKGAGMQIVNLAERKGSPFENGADCFCVWHFYEGQTLTWNLACERAGQYAVYADMAIEKRWSGQSQFTITANQETLAGVTQGKADRDDEFKLFKVGVIKLSKGKISLRFAIKKLALSYHFGGNFRGLVLKPV